MTTVQIKPAGITPEDVIAVARDRAEVVIDSGAVEAMRRSREIIDGIDRDGRPVYGVSTGFGALAGTFIEPERRAELQHALIRSHAAGVGEPM
ncbi:aromatic amino acid lyase, partial [Glycomyces tenuis]